MLLKKLDALGKPYKIYAEILEGGAIEQFVDVMSCKHVVQGALMADAHQGYTLPIGGVVACKDMIFPSFIGYDIGCGMCAVPTTFNKEDIISNSSSISEGIKRSIPLGPNVHDAYPKTSLRYQDLSAIGKNQFELRKGFRALGTLGGGNHFIEIGCDEADIVWIVIHSGSRGVGHGIAGAYMKLASNSDKAKEGCYGFNVNTANGQSYIKDMNWALEFALENRLLMILEIEKVLKQYNAGEVRGSKLINRNHNHAELRDGLWIHRKGATHAEAGMEGVIPGNMRDGSFIVVGKGCPESLYSSSHGAGRVMSRSKAKKLVKLDAFKEAMIGIYADVNSDSKDESPFAYKDIFDVMRLQKSLVDVIAHVKPLINIKG